MFVLPSSAMVGVPLFEGRRRAAGEARGEELVAELNGTPGEIATVTDFIPGEDLLVVDLPEEALDAAEVEIEPTEGGSRVIVTCGALVFRIWVEGVCDLSETDVVLRG